MSKNELEPISTWHRIGITAGWIGIFLVPLWIAGVRFTLGVHGTGMFIMAAVVPLILLFLGFITLSVPASRKLVASGRSVIWLWIALGCGILLGLFMPDNTLLKLPSEQETTALISVLFGEAMDGAASAISNPLTIIMLFSAIFAAVFSILDSRPGGPIRTEDEDEMQGSGFYPTWDQR